jgi:putative nucleotidyltransferase with HDIG domain
VNTIPSGSLKNDRSRRLYRIFLLVIGVILAFIALVFPMAIRPDALPLQVGSVADRDIVAPIEGTYTSDIATEQARLAASNSVVSTYLPADPIIIRRQIELLRDNLAYISSIRSDSYSEQTQKINDLQSMTSYNFSKEIAQKLLILSLDDWDKIQKESLNLMETVMRRTIKDTQLQETINSIPGMVDYTFSTDAVNLVSALVSPMIVPNSLFSEEETNKLKMEAAQKVTPVKVTYYENQAIVLRGQIISASQWEALEYFGLVRPTNNTKNIISTSAIIAILTIFIAVYFSRRKISSLHDPRNLTVIALGFLVFLFAARIVIPNRAIVPYFFPLPAFALIIATLFNLEISITFSLVLSILVTHGIAGSLGLSTFYIVTSMVGALGLGKGRKFSNFLISGLFIAVAGILMITADRFDNPSTDLIGYLTLSGAAILNGFASASLAVLSQFLLSQMLGLSTPMHLIEVSRSDHPLLQKMLLSAPGSYQHSLQVANLAEQAAQAIGADALLTRVGAMYHDAGKAVNPTFFVENQVPGSIDSHDDMDPVIAAQTIIKHVTDGVELGRKYHLPPRLMDFMREHHGTQITRYQYNRAVQQQGNDPQKVDIELFRYPGPKPQTRETAILMLADGCEARARAELPKNETDLDRIIQSVFDYITKEGLLENTNLTLHDLKLIKESFKKTLSNTYHARLQYPVIKPKPDKNESDSQTQKL